MYKMITCILFMLILTSCSLFQVYKEDIEQGNIITPELVNQLHPGLSETEVKNILGTPTLENIFSTNHIEYVYTLKARKNPRIKKRITLIFKNNVLVNVYQRSL